ncbi:MAG: hypothetical protein A2201_05250 [Alicyclobacillus sp. RIFOXYA1_FULL_53_8]|nr:MAG: hypothetical protein A2201_05250 [Alicyclobacillus sp. RIFOXYA1_FULL_53_8]
MAAIAAQDQGAATLLVEKGNRLGRKLGISGGGRCNVTNAKPLPELMQNIPGNSRFLYSALTQFSNQDVILFFEDLGIRVKEEDRGRVFPVSDKAATVVQALIDRTYESGVEVWTETPVQELLLQDGNVQGVRLRNGKLVRATTVIVAAGGTSVPKTGSTGDAYPWAEKAGHTIVPPYPTAVPLTSKEPFITSRSLQGLSLRAIDMTIRDGRGKSLTTENGDMIFTHFGLSGPAALRCSHYVSTALLRDPQAIVTTEIDLLPATTAAEIDAQLQRARKTEAKKHLANLLRQQVDVPERLIEVILERTQLDGTQVVGNLSNLAIASLTQYLKAFPVKLTGTLPLDQATVTGGGVSVKEIDPRSMASKRCRGLYFAGEVMDVHAHTGGYNITVAFSTGHLAGQSAASFALESRTSEG